MWIVFGIIAIGATFINVYLYMASKDYKLAMALALSFTALTICADYSYLNQSVRAEDWAAIADVVPGMAKAFWFLTIASIFINLAPVLLERKNKRQS